MALPRARMYDDELIVFLAPDPAGQSYSPYGYAIGNPIKYVDPTGRWASLQVEMEDKWRQAVEETEKYEEKKDEKKPKEEEKPPGGMVNLPPVIVTADRLPPVSLILFLGFHTSNSELKMPNQMQISQKGIEFIKRHEALRLHLYDDKTGKSVKINDKLKGKPTIGWGHLLKKGEKYEEITKEVAEALLKKDLETAEAALKRMVGVPLTQNQYDALVSVIFSPSSTVEGLKNIYFAESRTRCPH
jgi:hypothetical protein